MLIHSVSAFRARAFREALRVKWGHRVEPSSTKCNVLTRERDTGMFVCAREERPNEIITDATISWVSGLHDFEKINFCGFYYVVFYNYSLSWLKYPMWAYVYRHMLGYNNRHEGISEHQRRTLSAWSCEIKACLCMHMCIHTSVCAYEHVQTCINYIYTNMYTY